MKSFFIESIGVRLLLAAGTSLAPVVAHAAPGDLDPGFGTGGKVTVAFSGTSNDFISAMARDGAGNLYLAGASNGSGNFDFAVAKFDTNGQPVTSFGNGGKSIIDIGIGSTDQLNAMVIAGTSLYLAGTSTTAGNADMAIVKLDLNGQLVTGFGNGGKKTVDYSGNNDHGNAVAIATSGNIYLAGDSYPTALADSDFTVVKLDHNGNIITGFGNSGVARVDFGGQGDVVYAMLLDANENVYLGGTARFNGGTTRDMGLAKLDANGSAVAGFGSDGKVTIDFGMIHDGLALARDDDGNLYLAGSTSIPVGHMIMAVAKLDASGALVSDFATGGKVTLDPAGTSDSSARAVAVDRDGSVYVAGSGSRPAPAFVDFAVAELDRHGNPVITFGSNGVQTVDFAGNNDTGTSVLLDSSGHLYFGGYATISGSGLDFGAARLLVALPNLIFVSSFDQ